MAPASALEKIVLPTPVSVPVTKTLKELAPSLRLRAEQYLAHGLGGVDRTMFAAGPAFGHWGSTLAMATPGLRRLIMIPEASAGSVDDSLPEPSYEVARRLS
jgi:hypothetical protein